MKPDTVKRAAIPTLTVTSMLLAGWVFTPQATVWEPTSAPPVFGSCDGIYVVEDGWAFTRTGHRGGFEPRALCAETDVPMTALEAFRAADIEPVRTPEGAVCRAGGGLPSDDYAIAKPGGGIYFETCRSTAPEFAQWVVWHKPANDSWRSEERGIEALEVAPGDTVALVWTYLGEPATPQF